GGVPNRRCAAVHPAIRSVLQCVRQAEQRLRVPRAAAPRQPLRKEDKALKKRLLLLAIVAVVVYWMLPAAVGSSHREAPLISQDPMADNTDLYAFRSPDRPDTVTIVANYI